VPSFGVYGVAYTVHLWLVGKCMVDFLLPIERFSLAFRVEALSADTNRNRCDRKGVGHFERNFQG